MSKLTPVILAARLDVILSLAASDEQQNTAYLAWCAAEKFDDSHAERLLIEAIAQALPAGEALVVVMHAAGTFLKELREARAAIPTRNMRFYLPAGAPDASARKR